METTRESELEQVLRAPAAPVAVAAPPSAVPAQPFSPAGVMALQRLVGNAAVAGMIADAASGAATGVGTAVGGAAEAPSGAASGGAAAGAEAGAVAGAQEAAAGGAAAGDGAIGSIVDAVSGAASAAAGGVGGAAAGAVEAASTLAGGAASGAAGEAQEAVGAGAGAAAGGAAAGEAQEAAKAGAGAAAGGAAAGAQEAAKAGAGAAAGGAAGAAGAAGGAATGAKAAGGDAAGAAAGGPTGTAAAGGAAGAGSAAAAPGLVAAAGGAAGGGASAGAAAPPAPRREPHEDPNFQAAKGKAAAAGGKAKAHQPAAAGAAAAQAAAVPPGNEVASQAAGAQVEEMGAQQPGTFDRKAFIAAVQKAIDAAAPKNLEEADDFKGSGKAAQVKNEVGGLVKGGKKDAEKDIKGATDAPPDTSKAKPKQVTPLVPEDAGAATSTVGAAGAMPGPRPPEDTDLSAGPVEVDQEMEREGVTEEQLAKSNEPDFTAALDARQEAKEHSATAPAEYRAQEQGVLAKGREEAEQAEGTQLAGMQSTKVAALAKVVGHKGEAKSQDEAKRAKVAADIQAIYDKTKSDVTGILTGLDGKVDSAFTSGEESARKQFEEYVGAKMDAYKDDRYSGFFGGARWLKDKLFGMPDEVNVFYSQGRTAYLAAMDTVIGQVADIVGGELNAARMRIAQGRAEVRDYVTQLPADLQKVGKDAEGKLDEQFDQLSSDVDSKQDALVDTLAQKYVQSRDALDSRIEEMKAANRGLVAKALDAVVGVVKTILKLKDMLLNVLSKAADVIGDIITDPIGFLGNLIGGIKDGLGRFVDNIATHLENGLMGWLFGALGDAGIKMPKTFDLAGIFELVMDVLGLTYRSIRGRVAKVVGEPVVSKMEQTVDVFKMLVTDGPAALWGWVKDKVGDFYDLVLGGIKDFIIERVIKGGVMWLLSLLNPAAAFIKACKAIYDIVMFIVERGSAIMEFVNSVLDSIGAIARGQLSVAAEKVEGALAKALPLAISFLASLLGLSGITDKIKEGIDKVRKPIEKAVDFVVMGAVKGFKKVFGGAVGWVKGKYEKGKTWATEKATAAKQWGAGKVKGIKDRLTGKGDEEAQPAAAGETPAKAPPGVVAEEDVDAAPDEQHTLKAEVDESGQLQLVVHSVPQLVPELLQYFEPRVDELPERAPDDLPPGGRAGEQPRQRATTLIGEVRRRQGHVRDQMQRGIDAHLALHKTASGVPGAYARDPELTGKLSPLGHDIKDLLRLFHVYGGRQFDPVADEPTYRGAQRMTARITVLRRPGEKALPEEGGRLKGTAPTASGDLDEPQALADDPRLVHHGRKRSRGVLHADPGSQKALEGEETIEDEVFVRTWASGGTPDRGSNESHTESQFYGWFESQGSDWHKRVVAVELRSVLSVCGDCSKLLGGISRLTAERDPGVPPATKVVFWDVVWGEETRPANPDAKTKKPPTAHTTQRFVEDLGRNGWIVHGPAPTV